MSEEEVFLDFLGNPVKVGDYVCWNTGGKRDEFRMGVISRFTEKSVMALLIKSDRYPSKFGGEIRIATEFILVDQEKAHNYHLIRKLKE